MRHMYIRYKIQFYSFCLFFCMSCFATFFSNSKYNNTSEVQFISDNKQNETNAQYKYKVKDSTHIQPHIANQSNTKITTNHSRSKQNTTSTLVQNIPAHHTHAKRQYNTDLSATTKNFSTKQNNTSKEKSTTIENNSTQNQNAINLSKNLNLRTLSKSETLISTNKNSATMQDQTANKVEKKLTQKLSNNIIAEKNFSSKITQSVEGIKSKKTSIAKKLDENLISKKEQNTQTSNEKKDKFFSYEMADHSSKDIKNLEKQLQKSFKINDKLPKWVIDTISGSEYKIKYSKQSQIAFVVIDNSETYFEVSKSSSKFIFTKKFAEVKKTSRKLDINGNFSSALLAIGISKNEINGIMNVLKNLCHIEDIMTKSIKCSVIVTFNSINNKLNDNIAKNIVKITITIDGNTYNIYGFRNSIKLGTFYNKEGVCLAWKNLSLPMKSFTINSPYGRRMHPVLKTYKFHHGIDLVAPKSSKIYSMCNGVIVKRERIGSFGNCIFITNPDTKKTFVYAHMESFAPNVEVGKSINMNQAIGTIGKTGRATGQHLHLEIRNNNSSENPHEVFENLGKRLNGEKLNEFTESIK